MDERISLDRWCPPWVRSQHLARYRWACRFTRGAAVLDAACGTGYGTEIVARDAARIQACDLAAEAVEEARRRVEAENVRVDVGDVTRLPAADDAFDVYLSFETVEHVPDDQAYLAEAARVVRPGGVFLCSTPNRLLFHPGASLTDRPLNPFHVREYVRDEFAALLGRCFGRIEWFGQSRYSTGHRRRLGAVGKLSPTMAARMHQAWKLAGYRFRPVSMHDVTPLADGEEPEIFVAACTAPIKAPASSTDGGAGSARLSASV
jgi:SAM-dependent methyltransferase